MRKGACLVGIAVLVGSLPALAWAQGATPGLYTGKAKPGTTMRLRVTAQQTVDFKIRPRSKCARGTRLGVSGPDKPPKLRADGSFSYRESGRQFDHDGTYRYRISGKVTPTSASGTYRGVDHFRGASTCVAKVKWSVSRR